MPAVHPTTLRVYEQVPLAYRDADAKLGWPLLRWLSLLVDQLGEVTDVAADIDVLTPDEGGAPGATSALTDPATALPGWLPWLGQFLGLQLTPSMSEAEMRAAIAGANFARGSKATIEAVARRYLTPGAHVTIVERAGDRWHYNVHVTASEVVDEDGLRAALAAENPAGMVLGVMLSSASFDDLAAASTSFDDEEASFADFDALTNYLP